MLLMMPPDTGYAMSDAVTRYLVYSTMADYLLLTIFLGIITAIRYFVTRSRRRPHRSDKVAV